MEICGLQRGISIGISIPMDTRTFLLKSTSSLTLNTARMSGGFVKPGVKTFGLSITEFYRTLLNGLSLNKEGSSVIHELYLHFLFRCNLVLRQ